MSRPSKTSRLSSYFVFSSYFPSTFVPTPLGRWGQSSIHCSCFGKTVWSKRWNRLREYSCFFVVKFYYPGQESWISQDDWDEDVWEELDWEEDGLGHLRNEYPGLGTIQHCEQVKRLFSVSLLYLLLLYISSLFKPCYCSRSNPTTLFIF